MKDRKDMPYVGERALFVRKLANGDEFFFYGMMETSKTVRMMLYPDIELDWYLISRWKYESRD